MSNEIASNTASLVFAESEALRVIVVGNLDDLSRLPPPRLAPPGVTVRIELPGIDGSLRKDFEQRLTNELAACGCREGSIAVVLYIVVVVALAAFGSLTLTSVLTWVTMLGGILATSICGKIIGLTLANLRLRRVAAELASIVVKTGGRRDGEVQGLR